jgi:hypothetical protein
MPDRSLELAAAALLRWLLPIFKTYVSNCWIWYIFFYQCHHMSLMDFVVSPPVCGRSETDFWGWDAHEAQLRCSDEVDADIWIWSTKRDLKPKFY